MNRALSYLCAALCALVLVPAVLFSPGTGAETPLDLSPSMVTTDSSSGTFFVAESTGKSVVALDSGSFRVKAKYTLPLNPTGIVVLPGGKTLAVTGEGPDGMVFLVNAKSAKVTKRIPAGHMPMSPVVSVDGKKLYVCNRFMNQVSVLNISTGQVDARVPVGREPVAAALTPDARLLIVANALPRGAANREVVAAEVSIVDTSAMKTVSTIPLPTGASGLRCVCVSPDGRYAYVTHTLGRFFLPTTQLDRGWMNANALSVIDVRRRYLLNTVLLDDVDRGAANPWGAACSSDGRFLCVTHSGAHELSIIDREALHRKLDMVASGKLQTEQIKRPEDVPQDLTFLLGIRRRVPLRGNGPRGLVVSGSRAIVADYFSDSLDVVNLTDKDAPARSIPLGIPHQLSQARKGERYFHDAQFCYQQWQSCVSCHPDGRSDGLNWDLLNDGIGNPKQSKSMLLSHRTPPVMLTGIRASAEVAVKSGMKFIQFVERPDQEAAAIDEYLKALRPIPSPHLVHGHLSPLAKQGQKLFARAKCAECHSSSLYTNLKSYNVSTGTGKDAGKAYDTPSLVEVWRTAPYLCDGRAETMLDVLQMNPGDHHGVTSNLTAQQKRALAEFVLSL